MAHINTKKVRKTSRPRRLKIAIICCGIFVLLSGVALEFYLGGGHITYYKKWYSCGSKPFATKERGLFGSGVNHYYEPPAFSVFVLDRPYYCTEIAAEKRGFSANPDQYYFPHLRKSSE